MYDVVSVFLNHVIVTYLGTLEGCGMLLAAVEEFLGNDWARISQG
jgi:hypothetical protein